MRTYRTILLRLNLFMDANTLLGWFTQVFRVVEVVTSCHAIQPCYVSVCLCVVNYIPTSLTLPPAPHLANQSVYVHWHHHNDTPPPATTTRLLPFNPSTLLPNVLRHSRTVQEVSVIVIVGLVLNIMFVHVLMLLIIINVNKMLIYSKNVLVGCRPAVCNGLHLHDRTGSNEQVRSVSARVPYIYHPAHSCQSSPAANYSNDCFRLTILWRWLPLFTQYEWRWVWMNVSSLPSKAGNSSEMVTY